MTLPLRPHQQKLLDDLKNAIRGGSRRPMIHAATGYGKTVLAAHIVAGALAKRKRVCFTVPSLSLIDQTLERFVENGIGWGDMGVIQADHPWSRDREHAPIQIATAQTLARRTLPVTDLVVIDEAHRRFDVYDRWMQNQDQLFIGLSATPWTRGLGKNFDCLVKSLPMQKLIDAGYLSKFRVFAPSKPDLAGVRTVAGMDGEPDYHQGELDDRVMRPELIADIVDTWLRRGEDRPTLCFATNRRHAQAIYDRFAMRGVPVAYIDADTPREERDEIGKKLARGDIKIVCNIGTLTTGVDWDVRCLILARPTKSKMLFTQIIGRGLRTANGKADCVILDHSDTHERLGFVTDISSTGLDDGTPRARAKARKLERKTPLPKCCDECAALMPPLSKVCGSCGTPFPVMTGVDELSGELRQLGKTTKPEPKKPKEPTKEEKRQFYQELLWVQEERGRSDGWVAHAFKEKFGAWPSYPKGLEPKRPGFLVRLFVRHKDIAYAKSRAPKTEVANGVA